LDEARLSANIRSPYVVATLDLGEAEDGTLFLVMDLVIGSSLAEILRGCIKQGRVLPIPAVVEIIQQAARGLHDAHEATSALGEPLHIVHRDVSPQNILVGIDGASRITDFGVAHALERITKTKGRNIKGKLAYCSPEQARGDALDARSDVFALGIVLWESLTHRRLFKGKSMSETIQALLGTDIPDPRTLRPEIPERLAAVVHTALQRDPAHRFQSALEFAEALRRAIEEHVRTEDLRDLVKLIAGEQIVELVSDIRAAIEADAKEASRSWDDNPTELDPMLFATSQDTGPAQAETLARLKQTGQFLARPPSPAMVAASAPSLDTVPALASFSSSFEGPGPVLAPPVATTSFAATPSKFTPAPAPAPAPAREYSRVRWALVLSLVFIGSAAVTAPLLYMILKPSTSSAVEGASAMIGEALVPASEVVASAPSVPAPPLGLDAPIDDQAIFFLPGFAPRLWSAKGFAGGDNDAHALSAECVGYIAESPRLVLMLQADFSRLRVFVHGETNTSLVVRSPSGALYCNDDAEGMNPIIDQAFAAGRYEIFVASVVETQRPEYTLGISEHDEFSPRSFETSVERAPRSSRRSRADASRQTRSQMSSPSNPSMPGTEVHNPWVGDIDVSSPQGVSLGDSQDPSPLGEMVGSGGAPILR
ncbi:MAG: serine/threonine protein kinase, partial [Polyangiales bacterium]